MAEKNRNISDQPDLLAALARLERGQAALRTDLRTEMAGLRTHFLLELGTTRGQIMERLDHHQNRLEAMFADIGVNWHNADRVECKVDADREETRMLVTRLIKTMNIRPRA